MMTAQVSEPTGARQPEVAAYSGTPVVCLEAGTRRQEHRAVSSAARRSSYFISSASLSFTAAPQIS
jgi:hypothetical protein